MGNFDSWCSCSVVSSSSIPCPQSVLSKPFWSHSARHQARFQQTYSLVSSLTTNYQQSVMAAHVTTVSWVSPTFLDNVPSSSSVLWSQSWSYERATQGRMTAYDSYAIYASWWLHLFFALVKWPAWPSAVMTLNARDNLAKRGGWDVPLNHKRLPNNWVLERARILLQCVKACI